MDSVADSAVAAAFSLLCPATKL